MKEGAVELVELVCPESIRAQDEKTGQIKYSPVVVVVVLLVS